MNCLICKNGELKPGNATVTLTRGETTIVIKGVPADICDTCGEYVLSADVTRRVYTIAEEAVKNGAEIEVRRWVA